jgi:oligosaccharide repeat unit polymerase
MFETLCVLIGLIIMFGSIYAFTATQDGVHPTIILAPTFAFMYFWAPLMGNYDGGLERLFPYENLVHVNTIYLFTTIGLYLGLLRGVRRAPAKVRTDWSFLEQPAIRRKLFNLAILLGFFALAAYIYMLHNSGGFFEAYSHAKGGGHAESGYIGEALLLCLPAIILLALARQRLRIRAIDVTLALLFIAPQLVQGTLGGRRGPLFLALAVLFLSWFVAKGKLPSLKTGLLGVGVIGLLVILVWSQRQHLYIGSEGDFKSGAFTEKLFGEEIDEGNTYVAGAATILTADYFENYYFGYRYFVTFFVRPIPRQLWPTKYEDVGADWLYRYGDDVREERFWEALGFRLPAGTGTGAIADAYMEFWWGVPFIFYLIGCLYSFLWRCHRRIGGYWTILFITTVILSIYLATQSVTAWGTRLAYIAGFMYLFWKFWLKIPIKSVRRLAPAQDYRVIDAHTGC